MAFAEMGARQAVSSAPGSSLRRSVREAFGTLAERRKKAAYPSSTELLIALNCLHTH